LASPSIYRDISRLGETGVLNAFGEMAFTTGAVAESRARHEEALTIATAITSRREQARALDGIRKTPARESRSLNRDHLLVERYS
jgi:hypothetical protein